jgi:L-fuculose-phosphate aldolase
MACLSRRVHAAGWVANHDGNLSLRLADGRFLCTPTSVSKASVTAEMLLVVDDAGKVVEGALRPASELGLHLAAYRCRPDVQAVLHAHPPTATGFAVAGVALDRPLLPEAVVSLGVGIPTVPFALPGAAACEALAPFLEEHDAVLLRNHGVLSVGVDLEQAYLRMELVEHLARIALVAQQLGGCDELPAPALPALLEARRRAGLGRDARGAAWAREPPPARGLPPSDLLQALIVEEIARALGEK